MYSNIRALSQEPVKMEKVHKYHDARGYKTYLIKVQSNDIATVA